ncbi:DUF2955 domain-containing protein [Pseudomonas sp. v388]|uniref:DUF2955 domain-containing protein n=1 Tax=Pseudomonas sp. v388 TaxID=2479849 RepID=UPI002113C335|nr:DUF2955 domain-containing protein [Pseudomonas sp. v388]
MPIEPMPCRPVQPSRRRALRLATGTALCLALSYGLALPIPILGPLFTMLILAARPQALPLRMAPALALTVMLSAGSGLLLIPMLRHAPLSGVLLVGLGLFLCFRFILNGGNGLLATFMVIGLTMVSAAGVSHFTLALSVVSALAKGMLLAALTVTLSHWLLPEPLQAPAFPSPPLPDPQARSRISLRATLIVMPAFLLALVSPDTFMPLILKSVSLGQQSCATNARRAGRELIGSTVLAGILAVLFWGALSLFVHLWMFFLWTFLFSLLQGRRLYWVVATRQSPGFWVSCLSTLLILLGQSVEDSVTGRDVYQVFAVRMTLFLLVALYGCAMIYAMDNPARRHARTG